MAIRIWRGDAQPTAQIDHVTVNEVESGDLFSVTINRKTITVTADADGTLADAGLGSSQSDLKDDVYQRFVVAIGCYSNIIPEFAEVCATAPIDPDLGVRDKLIITGPLNGKPICTLSCGSTNKTGGLDVEITTIRDGDAGKNEKQFVEILGTATGGTFTLAFAGETTANIVYNAAASAVKSALEALDAFSDVAVTGAGGGPWTVEFKGQYVNSDVDMLVGDGTNITKGTGDYAVKVTTKVQGDDGDNEIQQVSVFPATGGTFTLSFQGQTTSGTIAYDASAATVQTQLETMSNIASGDVVVTKPGRSKWLVEFTATYKNTDVDLMTGNGASLTGQCQVIGEEKTKGSAGTNEIQTFLCTWEPGVKNSQFRFRRGDFQNTVSAYRNPDSFFGAYYNRSSGTSFDAILELFGRPKHAGGLGFGEANIKGTLNYCTEGDNRSPRSRCSFDVEFIRDEAGIDQSQVTGEPHASSTDVMSWANNTKQDGAAACVNEVQRVIHSPVADGGTFTLSFRGQTTSSLAHNISAADLETALEALSTIDGVEVAGGDSNGTVRSWDVEFDGATLQCKDIEDLITGASSLTGGVVSVLTSQDHTAATNEVQEVTLFGNPKGGTFTLSFLPLTGSAATTGAIAYDADEAEIEAALEALSTISDVVISADEEGGPWLVEFVTYTGDYAGRNVREMTGDSTNLSGADIAVSEVQPSSSPQNEIQRVAVVGSPDGGTFTLTWDGQTSGGIPWNADGPVVQAALESLSNIDVGEVYVTPKRPGWMGSTPTVVLVEFIGDLGGANQNAMTGSGSGLTATGSQTATCTTDTSPTGKHWWSEKNNWQTPGTDTATLPGGGDIVVFEDNNNDCLYGLEDNNVALLELHIQASFLGNIGLPKHTGLYWECLPTALKTTATNVYVGEGDGTGQSRVRLNLQATQTTVEVFKTNRSSDEMAALVWEGTHTSNVCRVYKGEVGIGTETHGDDSKLALLEVGNRGQSTDASVVLGNAVSQLTTVNQLGGDVEVDAQSSLTCTTYTKEGGTLEWRGEGAVTTLRELQGRTSYESTGTVTTLVVGSGGTMQYTTDLRSRTVTNVTLEAGSGLIDSNMTVTFTNPITLSNCNLTEVTLDVGTHVTIAVSGA